MKREYIIMDDFWWLPEDMSIKGLLVGVGHHKQVADSEDVPPLDSWYRSLDQKGNLSSNIEHYPIRSLNRWRKACKNTNVYRTLKVFDGNTGEAIFLGPFLVDIDNSDEDLDDAQTVTKQIVVYLTEQRGLSSDGIRIFFSGRKGFNVEICPEVLEISGSVPNQIELSARRLDEIIASLRNINNIRDSYEDIVDSQGVVIAQCYTTRNIVSSQQTAIDRIYGDRFGYRLKHPYIRLHRSINKWIRNDGSKMTRMRIELSIEQLWSINAVGISSKAEESAQMFQLT